ncbi:hypothetical protein [Nocardia sp. NPDC005366]|uniref:hypothetical protein n=1 Tax=Nocardia sp. NPDC005366 TaxID=3156878 RepID=UPI0033B86367
MGALFITPVALLAVFLVLTVTASRTGHGVLSQFGHSLSGDSTDALSTGPA